MEGSKQCPECKCTDVPINAEICPFCGYSFGGQTEAKPAGTGKQTEAQPTKTEKKPETPEFVQITDQEPAKTKTEEGDKSTVSEGTAGPVSTDYTTYKKKGRKKQADSSDAQEEKGTKTAMGWLAAALVVAVLFLARQYLYQRIYVLGRFEYLVWSCIAGGVMNGFLHVCCYANEKGSRRAGVLGFVFGAVCLLFLYIRLFQENLGMTFKAAFFAACTNVFSRYGRAVLTSMAIYVICWLTAAKLVKNKKSAAVFCLTAAEFILLPYLASWILYQARPGIIPWQLAVSCIAMLVTDFLLYRIKAWLAVKPRRLFWIIYFIIIAVALVFLYASRSMLG